MVPLNKSINQPPSSTSTVNQSVNEEKYNPLFFIETYEAETSAVENNVSVRFPLQSLFSPLVIHNKGSIGRDKLQSSKIENDVLLGDISFVSCSTPVSYDAK